MRQPDDIRTVQLFSVSETARHAGTSPATVRNWLFGDRERGIRPLFSERSQERDSESWLSFLELVEIIVARRFRKHGVSIDQLRRTRHHAYASWQVEHPFAERRLRLLGGRVLHTPGEAIDLEWPASQPALPKLANYATEVFEYDTLDGPSQDAAWASRFYPAGRSVPLMVDPGFAGGSVTFLNRGLTLQAVVERWQSAEPISFIASDFGLEEQDVEAALRYALA